MHKICMSSLLKAGLTVLLLVGAALVPLVQSQQEKVLTIAFDAADLKTLDPHFASATMDRGAVDMVFNGLVRYKPGDVTVFEPDLAERWDISADGKVWTFYLRQGAMCHPWDGNQGYELTSEDVVYSLQKSANSARSAYAGEYTGMTFEALNQYTVKITLPGSLSEVLMLPKVANYAGGFIVCKRAIEALGDDAFKTHPVGTGPFMFQSYTPMEKVTLAKNPNYFRGAPKLDKVVVRYMSDVSARESGLETGELDVVEGRPEQPWVEKMQGKANTVVDTFGPGETVVLHWNMAKEPFNKIKARWAVDYCISREEAVATIGPGFAVPLCAPVPPTLAGGMTCDEVGALRYDENRAKAKTLLAEAGYPNGVKVGEVIISERAEYLLPMQNVQAQLRECGVDITLKVVDHTTFHTLKMQDISPILLYVAWRPNADAFLTRFYHSASIVVTGAKPDTNFSHIGGVDADGDGQVDSIDSLIEAARTELDPAKQIQLWKEAQVKILEWNAAYPLYIKKFVFARKPYVDYGYTLLSSLNLYPPINELTSVAK
jgi:peptide/nickel transport system substrate-binding protein